MLVIVLKGGSLAGDNKGCRDENYERSRGKCEVYVTLYLRSIQCLVPASVYIDSSC